MANLYLAITDGTTTVTIADGSGGATSYRLKYESWAPKIAVLRASPLSGRGPYDEVEESLSLNIDGSSAADAYSKLGTLVNLMNQVDRFALYEDVSAVVLKFSPANAGVSSPASPLQALIVSRPEGARRQFVDLSPEFNDLTGEYIIRNVQITFRRIGVWLHASTSSSPGSTAPNPEQMLATALGSPDILAPTRIEISDFDTTNGDQIVPGYLVICSVSPAFMDTGTAPHADYSTVADSTNLAHGGTVRRFTPTAATTYRDFGYSLSGLSAQQWLVLIKVRANTTARKWTLRPYAQASTIVRLYGNETVFNPTNTNPTVLNLGFLGTGDKNNIFPGLEIKVDSISGSPTLDIDDLLIIDISHPETYVLGITDLRSATGLTGPFKLIIDHRLLSRQSPTVYMDCTIADFAVGMNGDLNLFTKTSSFSAYYFAVYNQYWVVPNASNTAAAALKMDATRIRAYLSPV